MATHDGHTSFAKDTDHLRSKMSELGKETQELGKITKDLAGDTVDFISKNAVEYYKQGVQEARKLEKTVSGKIQERPLQAIMIATGVGLVLGALWKRRA